jgi:hypothetical protein
MENVSDRLYDPVVTQWPFGDFLQVDQNVIVLIMKIKFEDVAEMKKQN